MKIEGIQEAPNFITLIFKHFHESAWAQFLHRWENLVFSLIAGFSIAFIFFIGTHRPKKIPSGLQNILEALIEVTRKFFEEILGSHTEKYLPLLGTLFFYILTMNLMGFVPLLKTPTSSLSITAAFALCVFGYVQYLNIKNMGVLGFLYHLAGSPKNATGWIIVPIIIPLEILTQLSRPITLSLRLAGNMTGEHMLIAAFAMLGIVWLTAFNFPIGIPVQIPAIFLALLLGFMQALVFTVLSAVYILLSIPSEH